MADGLNIGDSIERIETTNDYNTLGKNFFLKHAIENDIVQESVCFVTDTEHCMQGGSASYYDINKSLL